ncbi:MAG: hypothetical protein QOK48_3720 [Blastocatellia bacterium]|nr:hypothetical protein [Blastocatellia bacterium]
MKNLKFALTLVLAFVFMTAPLMAAPIEAQDPQTQPQATAIMRGYRTGYSDGYQVGVSDLAANGNRDFRAKADYQKGDRGYNATYGAIEEYHDGYQQGFEVGYNAGFDRKPFDSSIPADLKRRGEDSTIGYPTDQNKPELQQQPTQTQPQTQPTQSSNGDFIPRDTIMRVELLSNLSTDASQKGDHFQVKVVEPKEYQGALIDGRVINVQRPGKAKGNAQLQLAFDEIHFADGRTSKMSAQVIEVIAGGENVGKVDSEGGVQGTSSTKDDVKKVGVATGIGAIIGAIAGGGVGAAVGATIGAGVGTAGVLSQRGKDIRLYQGQHLRLRTAGDVALQQ